MSKKNNEIELYLSSVKMDMREIEKLLSKGLDKGIQIDELESV
jgi:hypothetical protein